MPQPHIIAPIELEGLSEAGKLAFVRDAYDRNKNIEKRPKPSRHAFLQIKSVNAKSAKYK